MGSFRALAFSLGKGWGTGIPPSGAPAPGPPDGRRYGRRPGERARGPGGPTTSPSAPSPTVPRGSPCRAATPPPPREPVHTRGRRGGRNPLTSPLFLGENVRHPLLLTPFLIMPWPRIGEEHQVQTSAHGEVDEVSGVRVSPTPPH